MIIIKEPNTQRKARISSYDLYRKKTLDIFGTALDLYDLYSDG